MKIQSLIGRLFLLAICVCLADLKSAQAQSFVEFETNGLGTFQVTLFDDAAPLSVANFLGYVERGDYDNTLFHRTQQLATGGIGILQGGGFLSDSTPIPTLPPVVNEFGADRLNLAGTIAYARTADPDSATSQFFFNTSDNPALDAQAFTVFGEVTSGIDVVNSIQGFDTITATGSTQTFSDFPVRDATPPVALDFDNLAIITSATVISSVPEPMTILPVMLFTGLAIVRRRRHPAN